MKFEPNYLGHNGFVWWIGVIENRMDPLKVGRCQVRIAGDHTPNKTLIPTEDLPWAQAILPLTDSSALMFKEGDYVVGFYLDGIDAQQPIMMGILPGIPDQLLSTTVGFSDPRGFEDLLYAPRPPQKLFAPSTGTGMVITEMDLANRNPVRLNEPTISRLARNEDIVGTIVNGKKNNLVKGAPTVHGKDFNEPITAFNPKYPYNKVIETESGHVIECDDTPGNERIHIYHRSGTFVEIYPTGTMVTKVGTDNYEFVLSDKFVFVSGDCTISANGNINLKSTRDIVMEAENIRIKANNTTTIQSGLEFIAQVDVGSATIFSSGDLTLQGSTAQINPGINAPMIISALPSENIIDTFSSITLAKLIELAGPEAPIDAGENPLNVKSLESPEPTPVVSVGPVSEPVAQVDAQQTPPLITPKTSCVGVTAPPVDYELQLSKRFKLKHLTTAALYSNRILDGGNMGKSAGDIICNLKALSEQILEPLCDQYPGFRINSSFRPGTGPSQHNVGEAADLQWPGYTVEQLYKIAQWIKENLPFDQVIFEYGIAAWIHVSFKRVDNGGNRASSVPNKVCSYQTGGWGNSGIRPGGLYATGLILLADKKANKVSGGGLTFA